MRQRRQHAERAGLPLARFLQDAPRLQPEPRPVPPSAAPAASGASRTERGSGMGGGSGAGGASGAGRRPAPVRLSPDAPSPALLAAFRRAAGDAVAAHAFPKHLRGGVLSVGVDSPVWLQELGYLKDTLRQNLARELGEAVREVRLSLQKRLPPGVSLPGAPAALASPTGARTPRAASGTAAKQPPPPPELPPHVAEEVQRLVAPLEGDPELLEAARRVLARWKAQRRT